MVVAQRHYGYDGKDNLSYWLLDVVRKPTHNGLITAYKELFLIASHVCNDTHDRSHISKLQDLLNEHRSKWPEFVSE